MIETPRFVSPGIQRLVIAWMLAMSVTAQAQETTISAESVLIRLIDNVDVPAGTAGVLSTVTAVEGQSVRKGERVAQIDDTEPQLALARAEIELELTKMQVDNDISVRLANAAADFALAAYQRLKTAATSLPGSVSQAELEELKHTAMQARLTLEDAKRELQLVQATQRLKENDLRTKARHVEVCQVNAPLEGIIAQVFREQGEWVEPGEKVLRIISVRRLRAEGFVNVSDARHDLKGAAVQLRVEQPGGTPSRFDGRVVFVHPQIDPVNGYVRVWAEIDNRKGSLSPGMRAEMKIFLDRPRRGAQQQIERSAQVAD